MSAVPRPVAKLRDNHRTNIAAKRIEMGINYDTAMMILKPIMDAFATNIRRSIIREEADQAAFSTVVPADAERIHQTIVITLKRLQGREIPLGVIFGAKEASSDRAIDIITTLFGDNNSAERSAFFRGFFDRTEKEAWFKSFFVENDPPKLSIRFGSYGNKPAILLVNADGDKDFLQYHITVSPDRIFEDPANGQELVRGYHFTNWFYRNGRNVKRNYFFNNGSISRSANNAKTRRRNEKRFNEAAAAAVAASEAASASESAAAGAGGGGGDPESAAAPKQTQKQREAEQAYFKRQREREKQIAREKGISEEQLAADEQLLEKVINENKAAAATSAAAGGGGGGGWGGILSLLTEPLNYTPQTIIQYAAEAQTLDEMAMFGSLLLADIETKEYFYKIMNPFKKRSGLDEAMADLISIIRNLKYHTNSKKSIDTIDVIMPHIEDINDEINTLESLRKQIMASKFTSENSKRQTNNTILGEIMNAQKLLKALLLINYLIKLRKGQTVEQIIEYTKKLTREIELGLKGRRTGGYRRFSTHSRRRTRRS